MPDMQRGGALDASRQQYGIRSFLRQRWIANGSSAMKNIMKLMEVASGLIIALSILLAVIGAFYR